jgi:glutamate racemase
MDQSHPIGIFDSGLGGLTVMKELLKALPNENFIYVGDTARLPYGPKSPDTIARYSFEIADFLVARGVKIIVVACNTASSHALKMLQDRVKVPVIGVIEPGAACAVKMAPKGTVAVLGTKGTIASRSYQKAIAALDPHVEVIPLACPLFVPMVEENHLSYASAKLVVKEHLQPILEKKIDAVLLGCTHYPLLKHLIQDAFGWDVQVIDSASSCAAQVADTLAVLQLGRVDASLPQHQFFVSDDPERFRLLGETFLGSPIAQTTLF